MNTLHHILLFSIFLISNQKKHIPSASEGKEPACNAGDPGSIPGLEDPLEEGMATHSSILAWRIPWTEEPDGLVQGITKSWT